MAAIQHRDREQIDQAKVHRQHGDKRDKAGDTKLSDLSGQLRDPQRATKFLGAAGAGNHLGQAGEGFLRDGPGLRHASEKGSRHADMPVFDRATTDTQKTDLVPAGFPRFRGHIELLVDAIAPDGHLQRFAGMHGDDVLQVLERPDRTHRRWRQCGR